MSSQREYTNTRWNVALVVAGLLLGFALAAQWNAEPESTSPLQLPSREDLTSAVLQLEEEQGFLKKRVAELRVELADQQNASARDSTLLRDMAEDLASQRAAAGLYAMRGPGVRTLLADSPVSNLPPQADPNHYIIHDYDIRDVVNRLWLAGAEAVAVNQERIVGTSSIICVGSTIMVNDTRIGPPYEVLAIGDPARLAEALSEPSALQELRSRVRSSGIQFRVSERSELEIPAYSGSFAIRYARPGR